MDNSPRNVTRFESHLLTILRFLIGQPTTGDAVRMIGEKIPRPVCLSPNAVHLVKDTLSKGCILFLIKHGGWRNDRILASQSLQEGRVWERTSITERTLHFSREPLEFLMWLTAEPCMRANEQWNVKADRLTPADELFFAMAFASLESEYEIVNALRDKPAFSQNALARLSCPAVFNSEPSLPIDYSAWFQHQRVAILESLQSWLAERWLKSERKKGQTGDWSKLGKWGRAEESILSNYLKAAYEANRPDLGRFLLHAATKTFANSDRTPDFWTGGLEGSGPNRLADRLAVRRAAVVVPRFVGTLADWTRQYRTVGYFDERYAEAQLWKEEWERVDGDRLAERARAVVDAIEPLRNDGTITSERISSPPNP